VVEEQAHLHHFFKRDPLDLSALGAWLDQFLLSYHRIDVLRALTAREQAALFEAAEGFRPLTLAHFVPDGVPALREVIHDGKNSLPLFSLFQKRFCRPAEGSNELWGYNEQPMRWATGPGYFKVREIDAGQVLIDYLEVPSGKTPERWPKVLPNSARLSRFVYFHTQDTMRGVSEHVSIGRAARDGKPMDNWFVLCRAL
jgi:hypothetical protein